MQEWLPEALAKRAESDCRGGTGVLAKQFRETLVGRQLLRL